MSVRKLRAYLCMENFSFLNLRFASATPKSECVSCGAKVSIFDSRERDMNINRQIVLHILNVFVYCVGVCWRFECISEMLLGGNW